MAGAALFISLSSNPLPAQEVMGRQVPLVGSMSLSTSRPPFFQL